MSGNRKDGTPAGESLQRRFAQLQKIYRISDVVSRAGALEEVCAEAVSGLRQTLGVDRVAILLADPDGVMRFKAWHNLPEDYRKAVEGHTPWQPGTRNATPITVPDVSKDPSLAALRSTILGYGIHALAFIPLMGREGVMGKFMLYCDAPHEFAPDEIRVAQTIAGHVAFAAERKQAEEALRSSERRFSLFMKHLSGAAWMKDLQGRYVYANETAQRIFRKPWNELRGKLDDEVFPPEIAASFKANDRIALTSGQCLQTIEALPQEDGIHYSIVNKFPILGRDGAPVMVGGVAMDITERKRAEEALRESEESYRVVAETAADGIVKIDDRSEITFANSAAGKIFGYTPAELIGQPLTMLMPAYLRHVHRAALRRYIETGQKHLSWEGVELPGLHKTGREIPLEISFGEFAKNGVHVFTGIVRDITERKRAERRLATEHAVASILAEFTSLEEIAPRILKAICESSGWELGEYWTVDRAANALRCTDIWHAPEAGVAEFEAVSRAYTFPSGVGLPGRIWSGRQAVWIADVTRDENFPRASAAEKEGIHGAFGFPILLGTQVFGVMEFFSREIREPDNELLQMFAAISSQFGQFLERKRLEEQLRQTQKLESIGVLAGGVAHDFNNLLTGILGNATLVLEMLSLSSPARRMLEDVVRGSERAANLTRQLLAYSGRGKFIIQPVNLSELVREIADLIQLSIPRTVQLRLELRDGMPSMPADPAQLQQLVMNLIINGAEAIGEGTNGTVLVATGVQDVEESYIAQTFAPGEIQPGRYVYLEVHDTGVGMDEETIAKIFDPFFTTKFTGRGLGLAAVLGIVRGHKGALKVYSAPGKGSTFKVLFPASEVETKEHVPGIAHGDLTGTGTVLVVDDEEIVRRTAQNALERQGYKVLLASNGHEAVEVFREQGDEIVLVLLDLTMPVMGGEEAMRRLQSIRPRVSVLLSSGYNEVEAIRRFTGKGLAGFIQKPYSAGQLADKVKQALKLARPLLESSSD
ncbi:MAG: PAS domain S-box protein [Bryobacteraceae bacterium]